MDARSALHPPIEPFDGGMLPLDDVHTMYWETSGNPDGVPVLFLHGGPGGGSSPEHRRFFDPDFFLAVLFDQRGAGASTPVGEASGNTTQQLIEDIVKSLVDRPEEVQIKEVVGDHAHVLELRVSKEDLGKVIGKGGAHASAIRTLMAAASGKERKRYILEIIEY